MKKTLECASTSSVYMYVVLEVDMRIDFVATMYFSVEMAKNFVVEVAK